MPQANTEKPDKADKAEQLSIEVLNHLPIGLFMLDAYHVIRAWNQWLAQKTSIKEEEAIGKRLQELFPELSNSRFFWGVSQAIATKSPQVLSQALNRFIIPIHIDHSAHHNITMMQQRVHISPCACKDGEMLAVVSIIDVTENVIRSAALTEMAHKLSEDSTRDPLTGLYNRRFMWEWLVPQIKLSIRDKRPLSFLLLDIDHFKNLNDTYGHDLGDEILKAVSETINNILRGSDIVVRYGGEEFVMMLPNCNLENAVYVATRLLDTFRTTALGPLTKGAVTISIGVVVLDPQDPITGEELLKQADKRLYLAKHRGRNQVVPNSLDDKCR